VIRRLIGLMIAILAAWIGVAAPGHAAPVPAASAPIYTYDTHHHTSVATNSTTERGPPANYDYASRESAVALLSGGPSAYPSDAKTRAIWDYDVAVPLVQVDNSTGSTSRPTQVTIGDLASPQQARVAAETLLRPNL